MTVEANGWGREPGAVDCEDTAARVVAVGRAPGQVPRALPTRADRQVSTTQTATCAKEHGGARKQGVKSVCVCVCHVLHSEV